MLRLAESSFDVFVTVDRNLSFQQNLARRKLAVIVRRARSNRFQALLPLVSEILRTLTTIKSGELAEVGV